MWQAGPGGDPGSPWRDGWLGRERRAGAGSLWPFKTDPRQVKPGREMLGACVKQQAQPYLA